MYLLAASIYVFSICTHLEQQDAHLRNYYIITPSCTILLLHLPFRVNVKDFEIIYLTTVFNYMDVKEKQTQENMD